MSALSHRLCSISDIPDGESRGFEYQEMSLAAIRQGDKVYIYHNSCPHLGLPLEWQPDQFLNNDKSLIQCCTHGALFTIDEGLCISGPCHGASLTAVDCRIEDGEVFV